MSERLHNIFTISVYIILALSLSSCFEEDEAINLPPLSGNTDTLTYNIEQFYSYFDFESKQFVEHISADAWEFGVESGPEAYRIIINSGGGWFAGKTNNTDFNSPFNGKTLNWKYDDQNYAPDSTAIGKWFQVNSDTSYTNSVYILANNLTGNYIPQYEFKPLSVDSLHYIIAISSVDDEEIDTLKIQKNPGKNFGYYSISDRTIIQEPDKDDYDILFGPYYEGLAYEHFLVPYLVRGVLLNQNQTSVIVDSSNSYNDIKASFLENYDFSNVKNYVGYEWKDPVIDFESGSAIYVIRSNYVFVFKTSDGAFYKFRFLGYSLNGENGYPSFQYERL